MEPQLGLQNDRFKWLLTVPGYWVLLPGTVPTSMVVRVPCTLYIYSTSTVQLHQTGELIIARRLSWPAAMATATIMITVIRYWSTQQEQQRSWLVRSQNHQREILSWCCQCKSNCPHESTTVNDKVSCIRCQQLADCSQWVLGEWITSYKVGCCDLN